MATRKKASAKVKRAAIYVRVSSEVQAKGKNGDEEKKFSPEAQEADCRALCERQGYQVVNVYRDTQRYYVGKRLVEPSGTRADRPGLRAMLAAARAGEIDVIIAWREDRLYRSYRPMLDVLDCIEETDVDIELAKETFDKRLAPVKAWAAKMELDAKHDRFVMGVAGRLAQGKPWNQPTPYGYKKDKDGFLCVNPDEADWVVKIWTWYAGDVPVLEIRRRLIAGGAPRRPGNWGGKNKRQWVPNRINQILHAGYYHTGKTTTTWNGETFEIELPKIIDPETARLVAERRARFKAYPAGNLKSTLLVAGLVYCPVCKCAMSMGRLYGRKRKDGTRKIFLSYRCNEHIRSGAMAPPDCARRASARKVDDEVWSKVWAKISEPGQLEAEIQAEIKRLQSQEIDAGADVQRLTKQLDDLFMQRQWVITQARTKKITQNAYSDENDQSFRLMPIACSGGWRSPRPEAG